MAELKKKKPVKASDGFGKITIRLYEDGSYNLVDDSGMAKFKPQGLNEAVVARLGLKEPKPVVKTRRVRVVEKVYVTPEMQMKDAALAALPKRLYQMVGEIEKLKLDDGVREMMGRAPEMRHPVTAMLAGIWMHEPSRRHWETNLDDLWRNTKLKRSYPEVIIGSGIHAAIYCAIRASRGLPRPLVVEQNERAGGSFAVTRSPSFFLNSRNRAGELSVPGDTRGALNVLPGAMLQPSDLSSAEYISNDVLAFVIRAALAMYADVVTGHTVYNLARNYYARRPSKWEVGLEQLGGGVSFNIGANRVIKATGLGEEVRFLASPRLLTFSDFIRRFDSPFPLRGLDKVAVIGAGDSGKTVIEALCGQGPQPNMSVASLDTPTIIDWYGVGGAMTCVDWQAKNRTRFKRIGKLLPGGTAPARVRARNNAAAVVEGYERLIIGTTLYTHVIDCRGQTSTPSDVLLGQGISSYITDLSGNRYVARKDSTGSIFGVGVCNAIQPDTTETEFTKTIGENATSIFRYASRAAQLAGMLPDAALATPF